MRISIGTNKLNMIDALLLLTGSKFILDPLLANLLAKLSTPAIIPEPCREEEPERRGLDLPDDVMITIVRKLDVVTVRKFTLALPLHDCLLPKVVSYNTSLPATLFTPDWSTFLFGRLVNTIVSWYSLIVLHMQPIIACFIFECLFLPISAITFVPANTPRLTNGAIEFFRNLAGLKSLEVELPDIPCYQRSTRPDLWFRWGGKFGVHGVANHCVFVFGVRVTSGVSKEARATKQLLRGLKIAVRHGSFHYIMYELGMVGNSWKTGLTITTRDAGGNGGLTIGPCSIDGGESLLFRIFHLPSTLKFRHGSTEDGDDEQDVMLMFFATIKTDLNGEATKMDDDLLKACFRVTDDKEEAATQMTELCHLVQQILAHEKCETMYAT